MKKKTKNKNISLVVMRNPPKQNKARKNEREKNNAKSEGKDWLND